MRKSGQHRGTLVHKALAAIAVVALGATIVAAAYDYDQQSQQDRQQQQYQQRQQSSMPSQGQDSWQQQGQQSGMQGRNQQIERQVAGQLRQEGFGQEGQIMVLAIGNRVILLGTVSDQDQKQQAEEVTNQVSGVQQVDNRLQVSWGTGRQNDSQLQQSIQQQLRSQTSAGQNIQVQARNGRVILSGQVNDWQEMANVLEAAFAAGAQNVTSQLTTSGQTQGQYGMGQDDQTQWQDRPQQGQQWDQQQQYGQQQWDQQQRSQPWGQQGGMPQQRGMPQMSASDLALAHRIAMQIQQQLTIDETIHVMDPRAIYVHVSQGTVKLHGAVQNNNLKRQAEQIARSVRGVQNVQNQLQTAGQGQDFQTFGYVPGQTDQSQWQDRSQTGGTGYQSGQNQYGSGSTQSGTSGTRSQSGQSSTGTGQSSDTFTSGSSSTGSQQRSSTQQGQSGQQQMSASDKQLAQQVEQKLQQQLPQANINVSANQGKITLQGSVGEQNQKQQAEQIAQSIRGVQDVQNQINVGDFPALGYTPGQDSQRQQMGQQQGGASDAVLAHQIAMQLQQQLNTGQVVHVMDPQAIYVHVTQGTVILHGSVQDQGQIQQAEQAIRNIRGVQNVQNQLQVTGQQQRQQWQQQYGQQTGQQQQRQQMSVSDQRLAQQIEQRLQSQLSNANINVMVSQGTATLQGSVQDNDQKQQAERIARSVSGVRNIRNNLSVGGQAGDYPALGYIPGQEDQAQRDTGTGISGDAQCIQMLKQNLTSQDLQSVAQNVYVTCHEGTMALYGYAKSDDEKELLEKATKQVPGVKEVDNNILVRKEGAEQKSDAELQEDVESQLWWSPYVDSDKIQVSVQNGTVILSGQADDWDAMRAAVKNAFDAGAKRVKSQIQYGQAGQQTGTATEGTTRQSTNQRSGQQSGSNRSTTDHPSGIDGNSSNR